MTRRQGDFADRGIHLRRKSGKVIPLPTPKLAELRCIGCRTQGVTVIHVYRDPELDWAMQECYCTIPCALDHGFRFPPSEPPRRSRRAQIG